MKLAITGANGFIGAHLVNQALTAGHEVLALSRSPNTTDTDKNKLSRVQCNYADTETLSALLNDCDILIHLAAAMSGAQQYQQTLSLSAQLLKAIDSSDIKHLVVISSIAIIDYRQLPPLSTVNEDSPVCHSDAALGDYARMKRDQETLFRQWRQKQDPQSGKTLTVLRPGLVYDDNRLSNAHAGFIKQTQGITVKHCGDVPVIHVQSLCAQIVDISTATGLHNQTRHLVDQPPLNQQAYLNTLRQSGQITRCLALPWRVFNGLAGLIRLGCKLLGKTHKIPDSFRANSVAARQKPFRFTCNKMAYADTANEP
ncbi:MAG: NAD(P)-dependent oxidoreductase [Cellvibrionaceae bacterium]|nr:NAD(P)-dependent oxidoreductase [Cellvibrionaceae bacterium]